MDWREALKPLLERNEKSARTFHREMQGILRRFGFRAEREVEVADCGGRLDLVARRGDEVIAFEFDRATPRIKSLLKLRAYPATVRVCVLRQPGYYRGQMQDIEILQAKPQIARRRAGG